MITIFFQGHFSSRAQAANYTEGLDIIVDNHVEHVYVPNAPKILYNIFTCKDLEDVGYGFSWNPLHWFFKLKSMLVNWYCNIHGASWPHSYITKDNIAGKEDVDQYIEMIKTCIEQNPDKKIVLFGCSRGAAATLVTVANLSPDLLNHVKLVIVEAPFDSVENVLRTSSWCPNVCLFLIKTFTNYKDTQQSPLDAMKTYPNIPTAFITSNADTRVPLENTLHLMYELKDYTHIHHLNLESAHHATMFKDPKYIKFVHDLYQLYI